jgi:hypothetical protein
VRTSQLEIETYAVGEEPLAAADHARGDEQVVVIHQAGRDRLAARFAPLTVRS